MNNKIIDNIVKTFLEQNSKLPFISEEQVILCSSIDYDFEDMNPYPSTIELTIIDKNGNTKKATYEFYDLKSSL